MRRTDTNRLNMINSTVGYCDEHATATAGITAFGVLITAIKGKLVLINGLNQIGGGTSKGVTEDTKLVRNAMTDLALKCANATLAYANSVNNNTLKALVNFTKSRLDAMKKEDVDDACQGIHDATDANIAVVAAYGVSATDVSDLQTAINLYRTATQNPRQAIISKSQAIKQAAEMVKDVVEKMLDGQLDGMANTLKLSNAEFVSGYYQAREVIDLGSTSAKVRGEVRDENTAPIAGVAFVIYETGTTTKVKEAVTNAQGSFRATQLPSGNFDFEWSKSGYKTVKEVNVRIGPGKELRRRVTMEAAIVREGEFMPGKIENVDLSGVDETITKVTVEAIGTSIQVFGSNGPGNGPNGNSLFVDEGQAISKSRNDFINVTSFMLNGNTFLNVQNMGVNLGEWRITFER